MMWHTLAQQGPVEVELVTTWGDLLVATLPAILAAGVAVLVVYLTARYQDRSREEEFRKRLRLDLYQKALNAAQSKLYAFYAMAAVDTPDELTPELHGELEDALSELRFVDAQCDALASPAFKAALRAATALQPPEIGLSDAEVSKYREETERTFAGLSEVVRQEFGLRA